MKVQKVFVRDDNTATLKCPNCGKVKNISVGKFQKIHHAIKVRCGCGTTFGVRLDYRRHYRKSTQLSGTYIPNANAGGNGPMDVLNISSSGVGFSTATLNTLRVGQKIRLEFVLDNRKQTQLNKGVIIRSIDGEYVGCEFEDEQAFEKDLGFYLRP